MVDSEDLTGDEVSSGPLYRRRPPERPPAPERRPPPERPPAPRSRRPPGRRPPSGGRYPGGGASQQRRHRPADSGVARLKYRLADIWAALADSARRHPLIAGAAALVVLLAVAIPLASNFGGDSSDTDQAAAEDTPAPPPGAESDSSGSADNTDPGPPPAESPPTTTPEPGPSPPPDPEPTAPVSPEPEPEQPSITPAPEPPATTAPNTSEPEPIPETEPQQPTTTLPATPEPEPDWEEIARSVVRIHVKGCHGMKWDENAFGSGTVVLNGTHVLTNAHVVASASGRPCSDLRVGFVNGFGDMADDYIRATLVRCEYTGEDPHLGATLPDLALLKLDQRTNRMAIPIVPHDELGITTRITVLGFPDIGGTTLTPSYGGFSGYESSNSRTGGLSSCGIEKAQDYDVIRTDADVSGGNSGGAAFNERGQFIGVPTYGRDEGPRPLNSIIPAEEAVRFLQRYQDAQP